MTRNEEQAKANDIGEEKTGETTPVTSSIGPFTLDVVSDTLSVMTQNLATHAPHSWETAKRAATGIAEEILSLDTKAKLHSVRDSSYFAIPTGPATTDSPEDAPAEATLTSGVTIRIITPHPTGAVIVIDLGINANSEQSAVTLDTWPAWETETADRLKRDQSAPLGTEASTLLDHLNAIAGKSNT